MTKAVDLPEGEMVTMRYLGTNGGKYPYSGYLNRMYRVSRGWTGLVHPDDVKRLERSKKFVVVHIEPQPEPQAEEVPKVGKVVEISITDGARALAKDNGIDLSTVVGSGRDGKIVKRDIQALC